MSYDICDVCKSGNEVCLNCGNRQFNELVDAEVKAILVSKSDKSRTVTLPEGRDFVIMSKDRYDSIIDRLKQVSFLLGEK